MIDALDYDTLIGDAVKFDYNTIYCGYHDALDFRADSFGRVLMFTFFTTDFANSRVPDLFERLMKKYHPHVSPAVWLEEL